MSAESFRDTLNRVVQHPVTDSLTLRIVESIDIPPGTILMVGKLTAEEEFDLGNGTLSPEAACEIVARRSAVLRNVTG